jgi:uncharacterized protein YegJ (DUF2314 family)
MGMWGWLKGLFSGREGAHGRPEEKPLIALVLLLREPRDLDAAQLAELASTALGNDFRDDDPEAADFFVTGDNPSFILKNGSHTFLINNFPRPYMDDAQKVAESIAELRLRKAVREHSAWLSVDLLGEWEPDEIDDIYRTIGKLTAALAEEDCLAIFAPATGQANIFDLEMRERLCGDNPLELFAFSPHPPVVPVSGDDPRLKAAVSQARRTWSEFVSAFEERQPEQHFAVKARIGDEETFEFMWLTVTGLENGYIYGRLDNDPIELTSIRCGDRVRVPLKDLNDWLYTNGEQMIGGYTIEVLRKIQEEMQNG